MKRFAVALLLFAAASARGQGIPVYAGHVGDSVYFDVMENDDGPMYVRWNIHERVAHRILLERRPTLVAFRAPWFAYLSRGNELSVFSFDEEGAIVPRGTIVTRHLPGMLYVARDRAGADWLVVMSHDGDDAYLEAFRSAGARRWLARGEMLRSWTSTPHPIGDDAILAGRTIFSATHDPIAIMPDTGMDIIETYPAANLVVRINDWTVSGPDGERIAVPWPANTIVSRIDADVPMADWTLDGTTFVTRFDPCGWTTVLSVRGHEGEGFAPVGDAWLIWNWWDRGALRVDWIENGATTALSLPLH